MKLIPYVFLTIIVMSIAVTNYTPNTYLTGWDNLHPEFNFPLNINRSIFAVWQEYQGLGLLGGMGHAADLPRQILLWIVSFVLPTQFLRYFYHFLMLFAGVCGVYILAKHFILEKFDRGIRTKGALLGSLFYLLNLGTIQYFYVPFEPYSTFWGLLPWELYALLLYMRHASKKHLLFLFSVNVLAIPQGYVPTIFLVYMLCVGIFLLFQILKKRTAKVLKHSILAILIIFVVNAFWLLPAYYFVQHNFSVNRNAMQNYMATEKFFQMNKKRGTTRDFIYLKEFYFDFINFNHVTDDFDYMMQEWRSHFETRLVAVVGILFFACVCVGLLTKSRYYPELATLFLLAALFFLSDTYPISEINTLFREFSLNDQLFRNPFTKFITPTVLAFALLFGLGTSQLMKQTEKLSHRKISPVIFALILAIFSSMYFPVWQGHLFYQYEKVKIPDEYFALFDYLNNHPEKGRVANFPQSNIWGWEYYSWGVTGSGFPWYAVEQPFLDRAFDVWSDRNENYYWEMTYALYTENQKLFESVLEKYQIKWVLIDESIFSYTNYKALHVESLKSLLATSAKVAQKKNFGTMTLYQIHGEEEAYSFVSLQSNLPVIGPTYQWNNYDTAHLANGTYISYDEQSNSVENEVYYPFRTLFTGRKQEDIEFEVTDRGEYFSFQTHIPQELVNGQLILPRISQDEIDEIDPTDFSVVSEKYPQVFLDGEYIGVDFTAPNIPAVPLSYISNGILEVRVPKIYGYYSFDSNTDTLTSKEPTSCDRFNTGIRTHEVVESGGKEMLRMTSVGANNCVDFNLPHLMQRIGYLVSFENRNLSGRSLLFTVINRNSLRADLETHLPNNKQTETSRFILPPMQYYGVGFAFHFENISIGRVKTINDLGNITVHPIPYPFLTEMKIVKKTDSEKKTINNRELSVDHPNPSYYQVKLEPRTRNQELRTENTNGNTTLILSQSFDKGWKAYEITNDWLTDSWYMKLLIPLFGNELKDHVLVNNWANGWQISNQSLAISRLQNNQEPTTNDQRPTTIAIIYLPQYLEYLGFVLLGAGALILMKSRNGFPLSRE